MINQGMPQRKGETDNTKYLSCEQNVNDHFITHCAARGKWYRSIDAKYQQYWYSQSR